MLNYFPRFFTNKAIMLYFIALVVVLLAFMSYTMEWYIYAFGLVEVVGFFYFANIVPKLWANLSEKNFVKRLFTIALIIRVVYVVFSYYFYIVMTGIPFEFGTADAGSYHAIGEALATDGWGIYDDVIHNDIADRGYATYLGALYTVVGPSIMIARLIKAALSAFTCVLIYKLTTRTFEETTGRLAGIFCMLMPNLIFYCGLHLKETEMLFLIVAFVERADNAMRSARLTITNMILPVVLIAIMFTFRTALGISALFAFVTALLLQSKRKTKTQNRVVMVAWVIVLVTFFLGGQITNEVEALWEQRDSGQQASMEWRSNRTGGNSLAKDYARTSVFVPLIFVIPFPSVVETWQPNQQLIHGGNYDKNIMAFFVFFAIVWAIRNNKWREYLLVGAFTVGYLGIVSMSTFAHSERFHLPAMPFLMMLAAFGISRVTNKTKPYFIAWQVFIFIAVMGWSWFKLKGRGLV